MRRVTFFVSVLTTIAACFAGARTDLDVPFSNEDASVDVALDVHPLSRDAGRDAFEAGPSYVPKGKRCARDADAAVPAAFAEEGGAPLGDGGVFGEGWSMPQASPLGGPVLARPLFVPITFADEDKGVPDEIEDFVASIGCTDYWRAVVRDYGVGDGSSDKPVRLTDKSWSEIDDNAIQKWLRTKLDAQDPAFPPPTSDSVYAIFLPLGATVTLQGMTSCQSFGAYHNSTKLQSGQKVAYAVMPRCGGFDDLTYATSHELIEAVSDPYPETVPAYGQTDPGHLAWSLFAGGEIGDLCEFNPDARFTPQGYFWEVQRGWSNSAAAGGHDPCVPAQSPYFAAIPEQPDVIHVFGNGPALRGVKMAPGDSRSLKLTMHADGKSGSWSVSAVDGSQMRGGPARLAFVINPSSGKDGDALTLTIKKISSAPMLGLELFLLRSNDGVKTTLYWGAAGAQ